jgi:indolepyruvate ferredoxin oxidoreductase
MTYRLLYNDAVAMTGGQRPEGRMDVPSLTRLLAVEGVRRIIITTPEPDTYRGIAIDPIASVRHRDELQQAQRELAALEGVTVLIHDDRCATEKRRLRKRGKLPVPAEHVWINERVCEGCGDCGEKSTCLSVQPVETEFGRKTRIHQSSCNQDLTCLKGDCPAFSIVQVPAAGPSAAASSQRTRPSTPQPPQPAEPRRRVSRPVLIRMPGIGGTGVVTVSQILQMAAHLDGLYAAGVEQTGLAQKGGPVLSDIRISDTPITGALRAGAATADVLIGFDLLGAAAAETLRVLDPARTLAVLNTAIAPTAEMITDPRVATPNAKLALHRIAAASDGEPLRLDATALAEKLFGESMPANMLLVGAAFQDGCLPLSAAAIERAIELNGAAVEQNLAAFCWGRAAVADPESLPGMSPQAGEGPPPGRRDGHSSRTAQSILEQTGAEGELRRLLEIRVGELIAYQSPAYARGYAEEVHRVAELERERTGGASDGSVAEAYARGLYKLMAYKDEYEVARLHLDAAEQARRDSELGEGARVKILLHPPLLRALGLSHKLALGATARPLLRTLHRMRRLRGTPLDPFGRARMRRLERELIGEYRELVERSLDHLEAGTVAQVAEIAALPDIVRGYEAIKLGNVERFRERAAELSDRLERGSQPLVS